MLQIENYLLNPLLLGTAQFDGASQITGLELIQKMVIDTLSQGKEIFVPITNISIFADITEQCDAPVSYTHLDVYKRQADVFSALRKRTLTGVFRAMIMGNRLTG